MKASSPTECIAPSHEDIAVKAYEIYEAEGRPEGYELEHWYRAEEELVGRVTAFDE